MDQYLITDASYKRLFKEYHKYGSIVVAFDFDNTIFDFHNEGHTYNQVIDLLQKLHSINCYLICWTASEDEEGIREYMQKNGIPFDSINENPPHFKGIAKKIYYNALLDDRAGLEQVFNELTLLYNDITNV